MLATFKEAEKTPFSFEHAAMAMRAALASQLGSIPSEKVLALALAKTALETGRWQKIWCFNWGNVKASPRYEGMFTCFGCDEILHGKRIWFNPDTPYDPKDPLGLPNPKFPKPSVPPGNPQTRFRAYANHYDGAYQYVDFIAAGRYRDAWAELLEGDAAGYVRALKLKGYFTADEEKYRIAVVSLCDEMRRRLDGVVVPPPAVDWQFDSIMAGVVRWQQEHLEALLRGDFDHPTEPAPPPSV